MGSSEEKPKCAPCEGSAGCTTTGAGERHGVHGASPGTRAGQGSSVGSTMAADASCSPSSPWTGLQVPGELRGGAVCVCVCAHACVRLHSLVRAAPFLLTLFCASQEGPHGVTSHGAIGVISDFREMHPHATGGAQDVTLALLIRSHQCAARTPAS